MKKLNNTEAELKKSVAYIKSVYIHSTFVHRIPCLRHPTTCGFGDMIESHSYLYLNFPLQVKPLSGRMVISW